MKIRIYPKVRYYDNSELLQSFVPPELSKNFPDKLKAAIKEFRVLKKIRTPRYDNSGNTVGFSITFRRGKGSSVESFSGWESYFNDFLRREGLLPDRNSWVEVDFTHFVTDFMRWIKPDFQKEFKVSTSKKYISCDVDNLDRYYIYDYQIYKNGKWISRKD
jgi:hypothetical protein